METHEIVEQIEYLYEQIAFLSRQIEILYARFDEYKFWLHTFIALVGAVSATIVTVMIFFVGNRVNAGIQKGIKDTKASFDKNKSELEGEIYSLQQRNNRMESTLSSIENTAIKTSSWNSIPFLASANINETGYGRYTRLSNGLVLLYLEIFCDYGIHPIAMLPVGYRPIIETCYTTNSVVMLENNKIQHIPIEIRIKPDGKILSYVASTGTYGIQCSINIFYVASEDS